MSTHSRTIPRIIHQLWVGDATRLDKAPLATWRESVLRNVPEGWEYKLWTERELGAIRYGDTVVQLAGRCPASACDYARAIILRDQGGYFLDMDVELYRSLELLEGGNETWIVTAESNRTSLSACVMAAVPTDPGVNQYASRIAAQLIQWGSDIPANAPSFTGRKILTQSVGSVCKRTRLFLDHNAPNWHIVDRDSLRVLGSHHAIGTWK